MDLQTAGLKVGDQLPLAVKVDGPANTHLTRSVTRKTEIFETTITRGKINGSVQNFQIRNVFEDRDGNVWFAPTETPEPILYNPSKTGAEVWKRYGPDTGLPEPQRFTTGPSAMTQTPDGAIWAVIGAPYRFDGTRWVRTLEKGFGAYFIQPTRDGTLLIGSG